jgi:hypothetical protein
MSAARQTVTRSDSFMGLGYLPDFTPAHQFERDTGTNRRTCLILSNPDMGNSSISSILESFDMCCPPVSFFEQHTGGTAMESGFIVHGEAAFV